MFRQRSFLSLHSLNICLCPQPSVSWKDILSLCKDRGGGWWVDQDPEVETGEFIFIECLEALEVFTKTVWECHEACWKEFWFSQTGLVEASWWKVLTQKQKFIQGKASKCVYLLISSILSLSFSPHMWPCRCIYIEYIWSPLKYISTHTHTSYSCHFYTL